MKTYSYTCIQCGKDFTLFKSKPKRKYCSEPCQYEAYRIVPEPRLCSCGCGEQIVRRHFNKQFPRTFVRGHQFRGSLNTNWKGGRRISQGYVLLLRPDHPNATKAGYVPEHVLIMSEHLGRPIKKGEVVHHKNEIVTDNRIDNLQLMTIAEHTSLHHKGRIKPNSLLNLRPRHKK